MTDTKAKIMALAEDCEERAVEKASFTSSYARSLDKLENLLQARAALEAAIDELVSERNALRVTKQEHIFGYSLNESESGVLYWMNQALNAKAAIKDARRKALEEAAKVAEQHFIPGHSRLSVLHHIPVAGPRFAAAGAAAIRALIEKEPT